VTYKLAFLESAMKEWDKLGATVKTQFKKKLEERLNHPHVSTCPIMQEKNNIESKKSKCSHVSGLLPANMPA